MIRRYLHGVSFALIGAGQITKEDWLFIISIVITVLGMVSDYLSRRDRK